MLSRGQLVVLRFTHFDAAFVGGMRASSSACTFKGQEKKRRRLSRGRVGMAKFIECPFCGELGRGSNEHVWAQWIHVTPGARSLLASSHGERVPNDRTIIRRQDDGRLRREPQNRGTFARHLPHVTVRVCAACNGGWMSNLESAAKNILQPFLFEDYSALSLTVPDLTTLATWATKTWMAYALTRTEQENPFNEQEYRSMVTTPRPLDRTSIWLLHSTDPRAHVGVGISSTLLGFGDDLGAGNLDIDADNTAFAYLAVSTVVMFMLRLPESAPPFTEQLFTPPQLGSAAVRRIWPDPHDQAFPVGTMSDKNLGGLLDFPRALFDQISLPVHGLDESGRGDVIAQYLAGANPRDLRAAANDLE
jgi:hypothetical protein